MGLLSKLFGSKDSTAQKPLSTKAQPKPHQPPKSESNWEAATVKWYNSNKGFGFLAREGQTKDIFVHKSTLAKCKIDSLAEGQKVDVKWGRSSTKKDGLEAAELRLSR